jgi:hypothetical protein
MAAWRSREARSARTNIDVRFFEVRLGKAPFLFASVERVAIDSKCRSEMLRTIAHYSE